MVKISNIVFLVFSTIALSNCYKHSVVKSHPETQEVMQSKIQDTTIDKDSTSKSDKEKTASKNVKQIDNSLSYLNMYDKKDHVTTKQKNLPKKTADNISQDDGLSYLKAYNNNSVTLAKNSKNDQANKDLPATTEDGLSYLKAYNNNSITSATNNKNDQGNKNLPVTTEASQNNYCTDVYDPYEKFNRKIYKINSIADYFLLRPVAMIYDKITNNYIKARVDSALDNITTPISTVNHLLQFSYTGTLHSFWRLVINTTIGVGGLFDVASKVGLNRNYQGFGDTLAHYGVAPGPYIMLPLFGGTTVRGLLDQIVTVEIFIPATTVSSVALNCHKGCKMVHHRAKILPYTDELMKNSLDSYINIRSSIFQNKESSVKYPKRFICPKIKK